MHRRLFRRRDTEEKRLARCEDEIALLWTAVAAAYTAAGFEAPSAPILRLVKDGQDTS